MHRLLIALLAALDAVIAAAGGVAVVLAPLTLLWVFGLGGAADWAALWPASGTVWQFGHLVPLVITLPATYLAGAGIDQGAASFTLSLAPLALAAFTALFAARSGRRAAQAGAPLTGAAAGTVVFTAAAAAIALTSGNPIAGVQLWQAVLLPALLFGVPALLGAIVAAWGIDQRGPIARVRARANALPGAWAAVPDLLLRGTALASTGLVGVGAVVVAVAVVVRGGEVVALFEAAHVDVVGTIVIALAQLLYLPTLVVWALAFVAGPGFALGAGSAVSPAGTQVGVIPGIPVLGAVPESTTSWLLLLALLPIAVGALAGWALRSRLAALSRSVSGSDGGVGVRLVLAVGVAVLTGGVAALLAVAASGSIGPGRLAVVGPEPGPLALTVGLEVLAGAAILLLAPRRGAGATPARPAATASAPAAAGDAPGRMDALWRRLSAPPMFHDDAAPDPGNHAQDAVLDPAVEREEADAAETQPIPGFERGSTGGGDASATEPIP
jgi:hypothetical protein